MWHARQISGWSAYARTDQEAIDNGMEFLSILMSLGFTKEACAGIWGNVGNEGGYNPWMWEGNQQIASTDTYNLDVSRSHGYGLFQYTPASKYVWNATCQAFAGFSPNYLDVGGTPNDGNAQVYAMDYLAKKGDYFINPNHNFPLSYTDYMSSTQSPEYLAEAWMWNYERPSTQYGEQSLPNRRADARYWYDLWGGVVPPTPPTPTGSSKFKWWLYTRRRF